MTVFLAAFNELCSDNFAYAVINFNCLVENKYYFYYFSVKCNFRYFPNFSSNLRTINE